MGDPVWGPPHRPQAARGGERGGRLLAGPSALLAGPSRLPSFKLPPPKVGGRPRHGGTLGLRRGYSGGFHAVTSAVLRRDISRLRAVASTAYVP